ncbi:uncharacterized protein PITG_19465 [Phytophthora infestans T30-4]|uniref:Uncharacterized protein n=1 Tax=Phytophthora infestans (strain T30-4) TaxID=403677 RepID=D0P048_PHYIT|nr:uncharacterized protein PITG_19465 [Phytophthora infestans T30-4]EEY70214.1 hypothetical protein PITG_19465 [Phytophthora infestans T30-4]|eukprot:XP_002997009.1 hypothetical protein PITG_19465 [Phytophthora infestans T30-4]
MPSAWLCSDPPHVKSKDRDVCDQEQLELLRQVAGRSDCYRGGDAKWFYGLRGGLVLNLDLDLNLPTITYDYEEDPEDLEDLEHVEILAILNG